VNKDSKMRKILITGGAGFIGSHLADYHLAKGDSVWVIDNLDTGFRSNLELAEKNPNFKFNILDIPNALDLYKYVQWADCVYHLAATVGMLKVMENPLRVMRTNILGTECVLRELCPHQKVLIASSSEVYELSVGASFNFARWNYALSKLTTEALALSHAKRRGLDVRVVRIFNTIGLRQASAYGMVVPRFVKWAVRGEPIVVYGDGQQTRSFCPVEDVVRALDKLISSSESKNETFDVGGNIEISILELAKLIKARAQSKSRIVFLPYAEAYPEGFEDVHSRVANLDKLSRFMLFEFGRLEDALDKIIEWERNK